MPNKWKENPDGSTDLKEVKKWVINDIKETKEKWAKEDTIKKEQEQLKEVWTEKQKVGNSLGFKDIKKINNKASTSKGQSSSSKSQKM